MYLVTESQLGRRFVMQDNKAAVYVQKYVEPAARKDFILRWGWGATPVVMGVQRGHRRPANHMVVLSAAVKGSVNLNSHINHWQTDTRNIINSTWRCYRQTDTGENTQQEVHTPSETEVGVTLLKSPLFIVVVIVFIEADPAILMLHSNHLLFENEWVKL